MNRVNLPLAALAAAASATFWWFGTGLHPVWWLTWLAALPVLWLATRVPAAHAFIAALAASGIGALNEWHYLRHSLGMPLPLSSMIMVLPALPFAVAVLAWRYWMRRGKPVRAAFGFAAIVTATAFAIQQGSPHSTWGSLAYSQMDCLPVLQLASLTGIPGIVFAVLFLPAALLASAEATAPARPRLALAVGALAATLALVIWGEWRLAQPAAPPVTVGLIASDLVQNLSPRDHAARQATLAGYALRARELIAHGAQLVVIPERIARMDDAEIPEVDATFTEAATNGAIIVAGLHRFSGDSELNEARVYGTGSGQPLIYEKHHMLPMYESRMRPGTARLTMDQPSGRWGIEICKDMDFPALAREYGNDGVGLLAVPAWDFGADRWLHDRMAVMRGVESGLSIARAAKQSLLTLSDDRGRVVAETVTGKTDFTTLLARVPVRHDDTLYSRWGDWFAWLLVAGLIVVGLSGVRQAS